MFKANGSADPCSKALAFLKDGSFDRANHSITKRAIAEAGIPDRMLFTAT